MTVSNDRIAPAKPERMEFRTGTSRLALALCWISVISMAGAAPSPQQNQAQEIKVQTELVLVPVIAHRAGKHVPDLKKENFTLTADGKPQTISIFEEVHPITPGKRERTDEITNVVSDGIGVAQRLTVIVIDLDNTAPLDQAYLKQEILKFLDSAVDTGEPFALVAIAKGSLRVLHDFTTDPKVLAAAVGRQKPANAMREAAGGTVMDITPCARSAAGCGGDSNAEAGASQMAAWVNLMTTHERYEIFRDRASGQGTLSALLQLAQSLRGLPGRKTLVWASSGIQMLGGMGRMFNGSADLRGGSSLYLAGVGQALDQVAYTFSMLGAANIAVYPLDARHGSNTSFANFDTRYSDAPLTEAHEATRQANMETIDTFKRVAAATGGKPCFNRTDLANCLKEAATDSRDYYMLGFYLDKDAKPGWHTLSLKLEGPKTELDYREGFLSGTIDPEKSKLTDLQLAMLSPVAYTAVQFRGRFEPPIEKGGKKEIAFSLDVPAGAVAINPDDNRVLLDIVVVARAEGGKEAGRIAQRIDRKLTPDQAAVIKSRGIHYTNKFQLPTGEYGVWFVVRDGLKGQTGSAVTTVKLE